MPTANGMTIDAGTCPEAGVRIVDTRHTDGRQRMALPANSDRALETAPTRSRGTPQDFALSADR